MKINNLKKLLSVFFSDIKEFSFGVAVGRLRKDFPLGNWQKRRTFYENRVYNYLKKRYAPLILKLSDEYDESVKKPVGKKLIWVMWWQGEENMPEVVKICYKRLLKVSEGCEVNLITQDNFADFVKLPEHIMNKFSEGKISLAHFSDVIRCFLLRDYGGVWLDATIYAEKLPTCLFENEFYTLHAPGLFEEMIHRGDWSTFLLSSGFKSYMLFSLLSELYVEYWRNQEYAIDYLFFDFFVRIIVDLKREIAESIFSIEEDRGYYNLNLDINDNYCKSEMDKILSESPIQKLTYKKELIKHSDNGLLTNYGWISERD